MLLAMTGGRGGMVDSGVSLRTNVKQSRKLGYGLLRRDAPRNDEGVFLLQVGEICDIIKVY